MALQLGMDYSKLKQIETGNSELSHHVLTAIDTWLKTDQTASWQKVVNALKAIKKNVLAGELEKEYCRAPEMPPTAIGILPAPTNNPAALNAKGELVVVSLNGR